LDSNILNIDLALVLADQGLRKGPRASKLDWLGYPPVFWKEAGDPSLLQIREKIGPAQKGKLGTVVLLPYPEV
jgi:hypothetical protein